MVIVVMIEVVGVRVIDIMMMVDSDGSGWDNTIG